MRSLKIALFGIPGGICNIQLRIPHSLRISACGTPLSKTQYLTEIMTLFENLGNLHQCANPNLISKNVPFSQSSRSPAPLRPDYKPKFPKQLVYRAIRFFPQNLGCAATLTGCTNSTGCYLYVERSPNRARAREIDPVLSPSPPTDR